MQVPNCQQQVEGLVLAITNYWQDNEQVSLREVRGIGVNLSPGEWNSRLQKRSPFALTNALIKILITRAGGFCLYSCGFNRQANVKLTPMG
ncbi:hypothetical protein H6F61_17110 [Cyanobacteria bacterium FACHB-472]|nr:hypothetical protein [Cyanobacteria bacterium FACHB-472]